MKQTMRRLRDLQKAKELLRNQGYYVANLWHVDDVMTRHKVDEETAQQILDDALTNDATFEQIWLAIDIAAMSKI
jgi:hypothetical protein